MYVGSQLEVECAHGQMSHEESIRKFFCASTLAPFLLLKYMAAVVVSYLTRRDIPVYVMCAY